MKINIFNLLKIFYLQILTLAIKKTPQRAHLVDFFLEKLFNYLA